MGHTTNQSSSRATAELSIKMVNSRRLTSAYPQSLQADSLGVVVRRTGRRFLVDSSCTLKAYESWLDHATLYDQLLVPYARDSLAPPSKNFDPGRARCTDFFDELYGASQNEVQQQCVQVEWTDGTRMLITRRENVDKHVRSIVRELRSLPADHQSFLRKPGGSFKWRAIAGTSRRSAHSYGIAIDINVSHSDYWRNNNHDTSALISYRNRIPSSIVRIFERHGFIWGGAWYHYDTMHFEFRPELCTPQCTCLR